MAKVSNNPFEQVYNASNDAHLSAGITEIVCVLIPRGLLIAGFNSNKELLTLNYTGCNKTKHVWEISFFEHLFIQEPLLEDKKKVKGVFVLSDKYLVVPDELYDKPEAEKWLRNIHFIEQSDVVSNYSVKSGKLNYLHTLPVNITELLKINFKNAAVRPLASYQLDNALPDAALQCCITPEQAMVTLHKDGQLLWHKVFYYTAAEDIAHAALQVCAEHGISQQSLSVYCNTVAATEFQVVKGLSQYFPGIRSGSGGQLSSAWDGAIQLVHQLLACAS